MLVYSVLNLLRLASDSAIAQSGRLQGENLWRGAWNAYIGYLRKQSQLMDALITLLSVAWTIEVPIEMLVERILGMSAKMRFVLILELAKYY